MNDRAKSLLIVDDDMVYRQRLAQAMEKRGWMVRQAESVASGIARRAEQSAATVSAAPSSAMRASAASTLPRVLSEARYHHRW